ncbi:MULTISPECIES: ornithine carbamoyltransferase [Streptomyces]|uniref:Ornithine carbamoyltransferase n=1 Tax=Streptomyces flaveolus TaxID=67297 RepID=A0ABV3AD53_9ACTN|nr:MULTISPECIES: ornithine carbamoyltransferase [Streptomyces]
MSRSGRRHLLSIADLSDDDLQVLVGQSRDYARGAPDTQAPLRGTTVGVYFRRTSTRTRTAFSSGALRLGAQIIAYGPNDLQENTGETIGDTGRVLSRMLDGFVARTAGDPGELRNIAGQRRMSVINAMTADEHPTQAVTDLSTILTHLGRLEGTRVLYAGEGNNTAAALALALARVRRTRLHLRTPEGYGLEPSVLERAADTARSHGSVVEESHDPRETPNGIDIVYTTRWQTTGSVKEDPDWRRKFRPFQVDAALMARHPGARFMHDLPAHRGEEVTADVLDGPRSIAFEQAGHKLFGAMSVLRWCLAGTPA